MDSYSAASTNQSCFNAYWNTAKKKEEDRVNEISFMDMEMDISS